MNPARRRYLIVEPVGQGGFGVVYRAGLLSEPKFSRTVAIKMVKPDALGDPSRIERLRSEARLLAQIRHRAIVSVSGLLSLEGRDAIEMEYVPGATASALSATLGPLPLDALLQIAEEVAAALHAVHTAEGSDGKPLRAVHRDVKPKNIRLTPAGEVKLLDFGIATFAGDPRASEDLGTPGFRAPEQIDGECSPKSDVYALGITMISLLLAEPPAQPTSDPDKHAARLDEIAARAEIASLPEDLRAPLCALLRATLAWEPEQRPTAAELSGRCRAILARTPSQRPLRDWADLVVDSCAGTRSEASTQISGAISDPLVGKVLLDTEIQAPAKPRSPQSLAPERSPRSRVPQVAAPSVPPPILAPEPAQPPPAQLPAVNVRPPRSGRLWWGRWALLVLVGVLLGGAGTLAVLASAVFGGTAVVGALVVAALSESDGMCVSTARATRQDLARKEIEGFRKLAPTFERTVQGCKDGRLSLLGSAFTMSLVRNLSEDGAVSDEDVAEITELLTTMESSP